MNAARKADDTCLFAWLVVLIYLAPIWCCDHKGRDGVGRAGDVRASKPTASNSPVRWKTGDSVMLCGKVNYTERMERQRFTRVLGSSCMIQEPLI